MSTKLQYEHHFRQVQAIKTLIPGKMSKIFIWITLPPLKNFHLKFY